MHGETSFRIALVVVILITIAIGIPHRMKAAASGEVISHKEEGLLFAATLRIAGLLLWLSTFAYLVFPASISWASIPLPMGIRWLAVIVAIASTSLFYWTLSSLGKNLTDTVVTRKDAVLVTHGPYRWVRHPFYVCAAFLMASVTVLTANWLIGISSLFVLTLLAIRTPKEEQVLIQRFGDDYRHYIETTGKFIPCFWRCNTGCVSTLIDMPNRQIVNEYNS
jgi:protein-S-isoprenylcysteine O-methyltransferase Ste14